LAYLLKSGDQKTLIKGKRNQPMVKIIPASFERIKLTEPDWDKDTVFHRIEIAARTCYKSEDLIKLGSGDRLVKALIGRNHWAMVEFGGHFTVKFICDRGFSHEIVRHRLCSFAQESTRYCDYTKDKFGQEISVIEPPGLEKDTEAYTTWMNQMEQSENAYLTMRKQGYKPQIARAQLPISVKTEIMVSANLREWNHIFKLRCAPDAHPSMRQLMIPLLEEFHTIFPYVFDTTYQKYCKK